MIGALAVWAVVGTADAAVTKLYWSETTNWAAPGTGGAVYSALPDGSGEVQLVSGFARIDDVEIDPVNGKLYWNNWASGTSSDSAAEGIYRSNPDGTGASQFTGGSQSNSSTGFASGMHGIFVDPVAGSLYFTRGVSYADGNGGPEVSKVGLDGTGYARLNASDDGWFLSGLVVDPATSTLYWGSPGVLNTATGGAVNKMATDGTNRQYNLVAHTDGRGRSLALDAAGGLLFYSAWSIQSPSAGGGIWALNLTTLAVTQVLNDTATGIPDIELDTNGMLIYWTDFTRGEIRRAAYAAGTGALSSTTTVIAGLTNPFGLALVTAVCGNSMVESGEQCDDGNALDGDCCSATCQYDAAGAPCPDGTCDVQGQCVLTPTELLPGRITIIKPGTLAKFVAKPVTGDTFALPSGNPVAAGGTLHIFDTTVPGDDDTYSLPFGASWKGLGNPAGSKGYKYKGAGTPSDPCRVVIVKEKVIKGVCKGSGVTLTPPFTGDVGIVLSLGTTDRYCAQFGGDEVKNDETLVKRKNAPAPSGCPSPPTTTSSSTSTTSSSTTTTSIVSGCFMDTGDGTIHDTCTNLQWEKKTNTAGFNNVNNKYSWAGCCGGSCGSTADLCQPTAGAAALCAANSDGGTEGCNTCTSGSCVVDALSQGAITTVWEWLNQLNAANFAGHNDWRLPSEGNRNAPSTGTNELETILLSPFPCGTDPCINSIFGPTNSLYYWSASTYPPSPFNAWRVAFVNGSVSNEDKRAASDRFVRAVRDE